MSLFEAVARTRPLIVSSVPASNCFAALYTKGPISLNLLKAHGEHVRVCIYRCIYILFCIELYVYLSYIQKCIHSSYIHVYFIYAYIYMHINTNDTNP